MEFITPSNLINRTVSIAVIGVGGTGSYLVPMLSQINYLLRCISNEAVSLHVTVFDDDTVSRFNVGRANYYMMDINRPKASVMVERLNLGWGTQWQARNEKFPIHSASNFDVIMTCVDTIKCRLEIGQKFLNKESKTLWIDGGNSTDQGNVLWGHLGLPTEGTKIPNWFDLYGETMKNEKDDPTQSCSHEQSVLSQNYGINHITAVLMSQYVWRWMRQGRVGHHIQMYDINEGELASLGIDVNVWKTFNYQHEAAPRH